MLSNIKKMQLSIKIDVGGFKKYANDPKHYFRKKNWHRKVNNLLKN